MRGDKERGDREKVLQVIKGEDANYQKAKLLFLNYPIVGIVYHYYKLTDKVMVFIE
jgi:hypothetical protein